MRREQTLRNLRRSFPDACVEFIPAFLKEAVAAIAELKANDSFSDVRDVPSEAEQEEVPSSDEEDFRAKMLYLSESALSKCCIKTCKNM